MGLSGELREKWGEVWINCEQTRNVLPISGWRVIPVGREA